MRLPHRDNVRVMHVRSLLVAALVLGGCGTVEDDNRAIDAGATIDAPPVGTPGVTLTVANPTASVPLAGTNRVIVEITRTGGFTGAVTVAGMSPPAGVTITEAAIAADATRGEVLVAGAPPLAIGAM